MLKKSLNNNRKQLSIEIKSHIKIVIVKQSNIMKFSWTSQFSQDLQYQNYQSYICMKHNMINYNHILEKKIQLPYMVIDRIKFGTNT